MFQNVSRFQGICAGVFSQASTRVASWENDAQVNEHQMMGYAESGVVVVCRDQWWM